MIKTIERFFEKLGKFFAYIIGFVTVASSIVALLDFVFKWKVLDKVISLIAPIITQLAGEYSRNPILFTSFILLMLITYFVLWRRLQIVAGEFIENFNEGLVNWEFGGEGWTTQRGEDGYELSVTNSSDGGIINFGFGWDSYEFSFDCKIVNRNVGWIVRASDRNHYIMIQLSLPKDEVTVPLDGVVTINPHYRVPNGWWTQRIALQNSQKVIDKIKSGAWLRIKIAVIGNTIDVFIENERALNHHIPDPVRLVQQKRYKYEWEGETIDDKNKATKEMGIEELESFSFPSGRIGFRCYGDEHAHIRKVRVRPLFWNEKRLG